MGSERDLELEKPETWDFERPEVREPVRSSRVVVSVAFRRGDFELVFGHAKRIGKKTSEFVREAAIEAATGGAAASLTYGSGSAGASWWAAQMPSVTVALGAPVEDPGRLAATTY